MHSIMNDEYFLNKGYHISTDKSLINFDVVYTYLSKDSYWAQQLPAGTLERAIEYSICFGIYKQEQHHEHYYQ